MTAGPDPAPAAPAAALAASLLTGQTLDASRAEELGLVAAVLRRDELLPRARALAEELAQRPPLLLRDSRVLLTQQLKRELHDLLATVSRSRDSASPPRRPSRAARTRGGAIISGDGLHPPG